MNIDKWLSRALVASFLVNCLLAVWLWSASRKPENVERATQEYAQARTVYDSAKAERLPAIVKYRTLRDSLTLTDTIEVVRVIEAADRVIVADSIALAAADTALAKADALIAELRGKKPRRVVPWAEVLYLPYSRDVRGRAGFDVRVVERLSIVAAAEATKDGPGMMVGARWTF